MRNGKIPETFATPSALIDSTMSRLAVEFNGQREDLLNEAAARQLDRASPACRTPFVDSALPRL